MELLELIGMRIVSESHEFEFHFQITDTNLITSFPIEFCEEFLENQDSGYEPKYTIHKSDTMFSISNEKAELEDHLYSLASFLQLFFDGGDLILFEKPFEEFVKTFSKLPNLEIHLVGNPGWYVEIDKELNIQDASQSTLNWIMKSQPKKLKNAFACGLLNLSPILNNC